ncbi:MAG TPA: glycyl-radical enzyme activating protein [Clostridia bacterium]|nr:glycyl-radical enzyme activating protein [Clostridia bacterium]
MRYFDIVWDSAKDGPGTRVVFFLQGCPLQCLWCHSPHSQPKDAPVLFYREYCTNCGKCRAVCEAGCFGSEQKGYTFDRTACLKCGKCVLNCIQGALVYNFNAGTAKDIFDKIMPQLKLLRNIGGVTLSGGEPLMQCAEVLQLFKMCKKVGVHTAVETSGVADLQCFEDLIEYTDCWLFGLKQTDAEKCLGMTGANFNTINRNLSFLAGRVPDKIIIRTPLIAGFTDDIPNIQKISEIMLSQGLNKIELLPCNPHTGHYYLAMGKSFDELMFRAPEQDKLNEIIKAFENKGIKARVVI